MPPPADAFGPLMTNHVNRERWIVFSKHEMVNHVGEATRYNVEVPNSKRLSRAFPISGQEDMLAFAKLFLHQDYLVQDDLPATAILREFFLPNAIRPTTMTFAKRHDGDGRLLGWAETRALEFYAVVKASDVKNQVLLQDPLDWRAITKGPGYVSISMTIPMETEEDMMHFVQNLSGGFLLDFMPPKCRVHLTNYTYQGDRPRLYQMWQPMVDVRDDEQEEDLFGDEEVEQEEEWAGDYAAEEEAPAAPAAPLPPSHPPFPPEDDGGDDAEDDAVLEAARAARRSAAASPPAGLTAAEQRQIEEEEILDAQQRSMQASFSEERRRRRRQEAESSDSSDDSGDDEAPARPQDKEVIQALMGKLFEEKGKMSEGMYLAVSNSLKRRHDQMGR